MDEGSKKAIIAAFFANLGIAISKFAGFLVTGSAGLAAESVHSFADSANQGLLLWGAKRSNRKRDSDHPFGYSRESYFWAFVVAMVLFSVGGLFALYEGVHKLRHPHETDNIVVAIVILLVAIALESFSLLTAVRKSRDFKKSDESWWRFIRDAKQPELPVVLLEDIAAEIGLIFALVGTLLGHYLHNSRWDAAGSVAIGVLLVGVAAILSIEMKSLLIGESASPADISKLHDVVRAEPRVRQIIYLHTEHLGGEALLVGVKAEFDPTLSAVEVSATIDSLEMAMRDAVPSAKIIFIEPDVFDESRSH
ncbi:MAG: cation diffusion facilitator family transporter [Ilumatobacteraceae bacterium]|nr:cation diffusion facilitator family transporter [Ilumatobacteraceae bacterium]